MVHQKKRANSAKLRTASRSGSRSREFGNVKRCPSRKELIEEEKKAAGEEVRRQRLINNEEIRMNKITHLQNLVSKRESKKHKQLQRAAVPTHIVTQMINEMQRMGNMFC